MFELSYNGIAHRMFNIDVMKDLDRRYRVEVLSIRRNVTPETLEMLKPLKIRFNNFGIEYPSADALKEALKLPVDEYMKTLLHHTLNAMQEG